MSSFSNIQFRRRFSSFYVIRQEILIKYIQVSVKSLSKTYSKLSSFNNRFLLTLLKVACNQTYDLHFFADHDIFSIGTLFFYLVIRCELNPFLLKFFPKLCKEFLSSTIADSNYM